MLKKSPQVFEMLETEARRSRLLRRVAIVVGLLLAIAAVGGIWWWLAARPASDVIYATAPVIRSDIESTVVATGTIQPTRTVDVFSELTGTIASVDAAENDRVAAGQALARLDTADLEVRLMRALAGMSARLANVGVAEANLGDAQASLRRAQGLTAGQTVSIRDLELLTSAVARAEGALAVAKADVQSAEADVTVARNDLDRACICAPIAGVILEKDVAEGQVIAATGLSRALFTIAADLTTVELQLDIDEADVGRVAEGDPATFTVEAWPDQTFSASITGLRFAPAVVDGVVTYRALLGVDNSDLRLRPGMTATASIVVGRAVDVLSVPSAALRFSPGGEPAADPFAAILAESSMESSASPPHTVWIMRDGVPQAVEVTTGLTDGRDTEIRAGDLHEGDFVIVGQE